MIKFDEKITYIENSYKNTEFKPHFHPTYSFSLITNAECIVKFKNKIDSNEINSLFLQMYNKKV